MKRSFIIMMILALTLSFASCGGGTADETATDSAEVATEEAVTEAPEVTQTPERGLPEGDYEDIGNGTLYLTGPSGSTENGDEMILYPEKDSIPHAFIGIELWDLDGSVQTYIYVDGVEMDKQQVGAGYQGAIDFDDNSLWAITDGEHKVEAVQYADNDPSKDITFYRSEKYTVKAE